MSGTKHTPGPWVSGGCVVWQENGDQIADLSLAMRKPEETEANTRLVTAAPDMLEALEDMFGAVANARGEEFERSRGNHREADRHAVKLDERIKKARAAFNKAKGGI